MGFISKLAKIPVLNEFIVIKLMGIESEGGFTPPQEESIKKTKTTDVDIDETDPKTKHEIRGIGEIYAEVLVDRESRRELAIEIKRIASEDERFVDKGGAGKVYGMSIGGCVKIMDNQYEKSSMREHMDLSLPVRKETEIQMILNGIEIEGVKAPRAYGCMDGEGPDEPKAIFMERLQATNLQEILKGRAPMPGGVDINDFGNDMFAYMNYLHEELGVLHGDLEARNVMVDNATGKPRIIDFGRSKLKNEFQSGVWERMVKNELEFMDKIAEGLEDWEERQEG